MNIKSPGCLLRNIPIAELREYQGKWIAVSADGTRIVAAADNLLDLDNLVSAAGENPQSVGYERVDFQDSSMGGAELL